MKSSNEFKCQNRKPYRCFLESGKQGKRVREIQKERKRVTGRNGNILA
jgi:hypothetical protein